MIRHTSDLSHARMVEKSSSEFMGMVPWVRLVRDFASVDLSSVIPRLVLVFYDRVNLIVAMYPPDRLYAHPCSCFGLIIMHCILRLLILVLVDDTSAFAGISTNFQKHKK